MGGEGLGWTEGGDRIFQADKVGRLEAERAMRRGVVRRTGDDSRVAMWPLRHLLNTKPVCLGGRGPLREVCLLRFQRSLPVGYGVCLLRKKGSL